MAMSNEQVLEEMESLVKGIEQSFALMIGLIADRSDSALLLQDLLQGEQALSLLIGPNGWRDRIVRKMQIRAAQTVRRAGSGDEALQSLAAGLLKALDSDVVH